MLGEANVKIQKTDLQRTPSYVIKYRKTECRISIYSLLKFKYFLIKKLISICLVKSS